MRLLIPIAVLLFSCQFSRGALVAYWNFNELSIASASAPGSGGVPTSSIANQGSGTLDLSAWGGTVDDFAGTTLNSAGSHLAEESLSLIAASGTSGNGTSLSLQVDLSAYADPTLSYAIQGTATGFNSVQLSWSTDGSSFTNVGAAYAPAGSYTLQSHDLSAINALDGAAIAYLRLTFEGATGSSGNNRLDNIRLDAIPEPSSALLLLGGAAFLLLLRRR